MEGSEEAERVREMGSGGKSEDDAFISKGGSGCTGQS